LHGTENVLELGSGYGRILKDLSPYAKSLVGIDISEESIKFGRKYLEEFTNIRLEVMDVHTISFKEEFNAVLCLQNALSALKGNALGLVNNCRAVTFTEEDFIRLGGASGYKYEIQEIDESNLFLIITKA
jgi:2-polyprenyl-6-hydroxyphenyl methylase/3-demethylubiquinone-9 3-methyltransferase